MKTFHQFLAKSHPEYKVDENWKKYAGAAALGAGLGTATTGMYNVAKHYDTPKQPTSIVQNQDDNDYDTLYQMHYERYSKIFGPAKAKEMAHQKASLQSKGNQLKTNNQTSGTFRHGNLYHTGDKIPSSSTSSPDAEDFLN